MQAAERLDAEGWRTSVVDARFMKPLDGELIARMAGEHEAFFTIEEGAIGGFGSHVAHFLTNAGHLDNGLKFRSMVLPDSYIDHDTPAKMYDEAGLNAEQIFARVCELMGKGAAQPTLPKRA